MKLIIDIVLLVIIALCTWTGYKRGLVGGVAGILAIIIALFGGSLLSSAYAGEFIPALEPFVSGYIDSQQTREDVLEILGYGDSDRSLNDILTEDPSLRYDYAYECFTAMGLYEKRAEELADIFSGNIGECKAVLSDNESETRIIETAKKAAAAAAAVIIRAYSL